MTEDAPTPGRYTTFLEVAHQLGVARTTVYDKVAVGQLVKVDVGTTGRRWPITRASFDAYCSRIEAEAARPPRRATDPPRPAG